MSANNPHRGFCYPSRCWRLETPLSRGIGRRQGEWKESSAPENRFAFVRIASHPSTELQGPALRVRRLGRPRRRNHEGRRLSKKPPTIRPLRPALRLWVSISRPKGVSRLRSPRIGVRLLLSEVLPADRRLHRGSGNFRKLAAEAEGLSRANRWETWRRVVARQPQRQR
jgi:hypothetical protein